MNLTQQQNDSALQSDRRRSNTTKPSANGFNDLGIAPGLLKAIDRLKFKSPTPIQNKAIPVCINGDDIIAIAQTGSGKTLAFGIPMLQRLAQSKNGTGLVLVPTRELAVQVDEALKAVGRSINMRSVVLIGGASMAMQRNALKKNPRVIIATPGRLMDHVERRTIKLSNTEVLVLDEADRMLDMGFAPDIKKIMKSIPEQRQTMLFSATMPKEIVAIAEKLMKSPTRIEVDRSGAIPTEVSQELFFIKNQDKSRLLAVQLKQRSGPVLVFTRTKRTASKLTGKTNNMGFAVAQIHSDRSLAQRRNALEGFKKGKYQVLIATDIAARGIDVSGIELVVNYDMPANSEDYVHRIGRTGRAGKNGHAISFATTAQKGAIKSLERFMKRELTISALPKLPSEKLLIEEAELLNIGNLSSRDEKPSRRKPSRARSPRRQGYKQTDSYKFATKRLESKEAELNRKDSSKTKSKQKVSKAQPSQKVAKIQTDSKDESPFWTNFKKHRPVKKKSVGQGSRRKRRAKRK